jgi:hypothetical protein
VCRSIPTASRLAKRERCVKLFSGVGGIEVSMQGKASNQERLTEDEMVRRKLGPRGIPGADDTAKMTPQQRENLPKEGEFDGHVA